jgi:flavin-binding protein dodecin
MTDHIYKLVELTGSSTVSIEDAVQKAIARAHQTIRNMHWFNITETRGHVIDGKVAHWQVSLKVGFTLESETE